MPKRAYPVVVTLAFYLLACGRISTLRLHCISGGATVAEEDVYRRSIRFTRFVEQDFIPELTAIDANKLDDSLDKLTKWPDASFWSSVNLKCMAYLASTKLLDNDGGQKAKVAIEIHTEHLRQVASSIMLADISVEYLERLTKSGT